MRQNIDKYESWNKKLTKLKRNIRRWHVGLQLLSQKHPEYHKFYMHKCRIKNEFLHTTLRFFRNTWLKRYKNFNKPPGLGSVWTTWTSYNYGYSLRNIQWLYLTLICLLLETTGVGMMTLCVILLISHTNSHEHIFSNFLLLIH